MNRMQTELLYAAISQYEAQATRAEANLRVYLNRVAGVAEHPDAVGEVMEFAGTIATAKDNIRVLHEFLSDAKDTTA